MKSNNKTVQQKEIIFLLDDEPQYLAWLVEYLEAKGYAVETASNLGEAIRKLVPRKYRTVIADLSVPIPTEMRKMVEAEGAAYLQFPGLYVAHHARNVGYRSRQVVVYSVHDSATVAEVAGKIGVCYITKGRPKLLKVELDAILCYDPTREK